MPVIGDSSEERSDVGRPCDVISEFICDVMLVGAPPTVVVAMVKGKDVVGFEMNWGCCGGNVVYCVPPGCAVTVVCGCACANAGTPPSCMFTDPTCVASTAAGGATA